MSIIEYRHIMINIGLETHINLNTKRKLFCKCKTGKDTCDICTGQPGAIIQRANPYAIKKVLVLKEALKGKHNDLIFFRKHYRYFDTPNNYQRSQAPYLPFIYDCNLLLLKSNRLVSVKGYLEEDPASLKKNKVLFARCGCPLLELVTQLQSFEDLDCARSFIKEYLFTLKQLVQDLDIAEKNKLFKTDLNVSLSNTPRIEIKNITSYKDLLSALQHSVRLLQDSNIKEDSTYSFVKNKLIYSRKKQDYLFSRQWNHKIIKILPTKKPPKVTLYSMASDLIHTKNIDPMYMKTYISYIKTLLKNLKHIDIYDFLYLDPSIGLKKLELHKKQSSDLEEVVLHYVKKSGLTKRSFDLKDQTFRDLIKQVKKELLNCKIMFSSYTINTIIENYFRAFS